MFKLREMCSNDAFSLTSGITPVRAWGRKSANVTKHMGIKFSTLTHLWTFQLDRLSSAGVAVLQGNTQIYLIPCSFTATFKFILSLYCFEKEISSDRNWKEKLLALSRATMASTECAKAVTLQAIPLFHGLQIFFIYVCL